MDTVPLESSLYFFLRVPPRYFVSVKRLLIADDTFMSPVPLGVCHFVPSLEGPLADTFPLKPF